MKRRTTSEGFVWEVGSNPPQALLYDFDVGSASLKSAHARYLEKIVARVLGDSKKIWKIKIEGRASRTGSDQHNMALSRQRAEAVYEFISRKTAQAKLSKDWVGETLAEREGEKDGRENMFYRAVEVVVRSEDQPPPPPIKLIPPKPALPPSRKSFRVRVLGGSSSAISIPINPVANPSLSRDNYMLEIWDTEENTTATYAFEGTGTGVGVGPPKVPGSATVTLSGGDWNAFTAPAYISVNDFAGPAMFEFLSLTYVAGTMGPTTFSFRPLHWYSPGFGFRISNFQMGRTVGVPGVTLGSTTGMLTRVGQGKAPH